MPKKSKMPIDWAIAVSANRLSVVQLADICTKVEVEKTLFRLGKNFGYLLPYSTTYNFGSTHQSSTSLSIGALGIACSLRIRC